MRKIFPTWDEIERLVERLLTQIPPDFDLVLTITRAGVFPTSLLCERLGLRNITSTSVMFYTDTGETLERPVFLNFPPDDVLRGKRVLIIDEVWDTGQTMEAVRQRVIAAGGDPKVAVLHYKPTHSVVEGEPDYWAAETDCWVVYPWDPKREAMLAHAGHHGAHGGAHAHATG